MSIKIGQLRKCKYRSNLYIKIMGIDGDFVHIKLCYDLGIPNVYRLTTSDILHNFYAIVNLEEELDKL